MTGPENTRNRLAAESTLNLLRQICNLIPEHLVRCGTSRVRPAGRRVNFLTIDFSILEQLRQPSDTSR